MYRIGNIYVLAAFGTIGGALFGFDVSSMSAWIGAKQYTDYFHNPDSTLQGGITASMSAGSFVGALAAGFLSDRLGRRVALGIACCVWIIGAAIVCSSQNVAQLIAGRVVCGLSVGVTSSQVCVYLAELAPGRIRGRIVGIQQWAIEWGILIMYLIAYGCTFVAGPSAFRISWGIQAVPAAILLAALPFFPESPRWLAAQERWDEALDVLALIHAKGDVNDPTVQAEMLEVREAVEVMKLQKNTTFLGLFGPKIWKRTVAGTSVQMWQQLLGGNVAMYYIVYVFNMAGLTGNVNLYSSAIQYVLFLVTTGAILPFIDRIGRRFLLLTGSILCCIIHFAIAGTMASHGHSVDQIGGNANLKWQVTDGSAAKAIIALMYIFVSIYGFTWAPTGWIYCSEVFPLQWRAKGVGLSAATNWAFNFALAFFVAPAFTNITWRTYIIFGVFCFAMTFHIFFTYPETQGKTLEEMDAVFDSKIPAWKTGNVQGLFAQRIDQVNAKGVDSVSEDVKVDGKRSTDADRKEVV
ncbi:sugar transporter [Myriangium duriaei CBS 260.36]|uniref:Sugar transporter n=1 Tax=Myriangium duriaei CBS 260.36 TaxID=1168546 RepID=A0A9P4MGR1_9PEZI|nr:sugar transporter [Myriangium duriaei CBS 260.36]